MDHLAILAPKFKLLDKILSGEKSIESRWTVNKIAPWDKIKPGETVYFKDSGKSVTAKATVEKVLQFELAEISAEEIVNEYGKQIAIQNKDVGIWSAGKKYCVLIFLQHPEPIQPFNIDRTGYGSGAAWLTAESIELITRS